jgi:hypothetical protein
MKMSSGSGERDRERRGGRENFVHVTCQLNQTKRQINKGTKFKEPE